MNGPEEWVWEVLQPLLPMKRCLFVDAGAHEGEWSMPLANMFERVLSFEPQPKLAESLTKRAPTHVQVLACGLHEESKLRRFTRYASTAHTSCVFHAGGINTGNAGDVVRYPVLALDQLALPFMDLLKIDTEGAERHVVLGALETINRCKPVLCIECHTMGVGLTIMDALPEYRWQTVHHPLYEPDSIYLESHVWMIGEPTGEPPA